MNTTGYSLGEDPAFSIGKTHSLWWLAVADSLGYRAGLGGDCTAEMDLDREGKLQSWSMCSSVLVPRIPYSGKD